MAYLKKSQGSKVSKFSFARQKKDVIKLKNILKVSGEYNVYNSLAALTVARALKISDKISFKTLGEFTGAWRRMETIGKYKGVKIISDYAHHPTEVRAVLTALTSNHKSQITKYKQITRPKVQNLKQRPNTIVIFQPHQRNRTEKLFDDFVRVFGKTDPKLQVIITDIYEVAGREKKQKNKNSRVLVETINKKYPNANVIYIPKEKLGSYVRDNVSNFPPSLRLRRTGKFSAKGGSATGGQISNSIVFMGAGDIDNIARTFIHRRKR